MFDLLLHYDETSITSNNRASMVRQSRDRLTVATAIVCGGMLYLW